MPKYVLRTPSGHGTQTRVFTDEEEMLEYAQFALNHPSMYGKVEIERQGTEGE